MVLFLFFLMNLLIFSNQAMQQQKQYFEPGAHNITFCYDNDELLAYHQVLNDHKSMLYTSHEEYGYEVFAIENGKIRRVAKHEAAEERFEKISRLFSEKNNK